MTTDTYATMTCGSLAEVPLTGSLDEFFKMKQQQHQQGGAKDHQLISQKHPSQGRH